PPASTLLPYTTLFRSGLDAERHLDVLFVRNRDIDEGHELTHHVGSGSAPLPEVLAIVEIAGNGEALLTRLADGFERERGRRFARSEEHTSELQSPYDL